MPGRQAKAITPSALRSLLAFARRSSFPERDRVIILLSVRAGLRACEIARLEWAMVLDAKDRVGDTVAIHDAIAKKGSGRRVPIHDELRKALVALLRQTGPTGAVIRSARGGCMRPNSIVNWFVVLCRELQLTGCSSHSGRRTFITAAARNAHRAGCSLRDVQLLAGHRSIETTQRYIDGDSHGQRKLVALL
ncbi:tyrosine-type recombinase/integrase [Falsiroseomonas sp. E2-1-a20]|uniref:tyrosine-type recombinase/integrase n=1 Tax=Falsiroseomonas sp. E2-1-a20 TaxID=3239300 RepID=UPI003F411BD0